MRVIAHLPGIREIYASRTNHVRFGRRVTTGDDRPQMATSDCTRPSLVLVRRGLQRWGSGDHGRRAGHTCRAERRCGCSRCRPAFAPPPACALAKGNTEGYWCSSACSLAVLAGEGVLSGVRVRSRFRRSSSARRSGGGGSIRLVIPISAGLGVALALRSGSRIAQALGVRVASAGLGRTAVAVCSTPLPGGVAPAFRRSNLFLLVLAALLKLRFQVRLCVLVSAPGGSVPVPWPASPNRVGYRAGCRTRRPRRLRRR